MKFAMVTVISVCTFATGVFAQEFREVDLLALVDIKSHVATGAWVSTDEGLKANVPSDRGMCVLPYELSGPYELNYEFTRENGNDVVGVILPLNRTQVLLELSGWGGEAHGLARIDGESCRSEKNPTSVRPGVLKNGQRQRVVVRVNPKGDNLAIEASLNGEDLFKWSGAYNRAEPNVGIRIESNTRPALFVAKSNTIFHKFSVRHAEGDGKKVEIAQTRPDSPASAIEPGKVDLTKVAWTETSGKIEVVEFQQQNVLRTVGEDDTVAFLPGAELGDGVIEVEIAADIFSGIAFRGADTKNYDLIYFRPQNSGTDKHKNTVQYVSKGVDGADWRTLRSTFPGKYESGAEMKVNEWFKVRIELEGETARTFVNDSEKPVLVVEKLLGKRPAGKIGVWGWNSHFRNFSFEPAASSR